MTLSAGGGLQRPIDSEQATLHLLKGPFVVIGGRRLEIPEGGKRLLAFIALNGGRVERKQAAGTLWPLGDDSRAAGNLRSALWRLKGAGICLIESDKCALTLQPGTVVDVTVIVDWARRIIEGSAVAEDLRTSDWCVDALDLLPGWYDEWVLFEREHLRQRLLYALEALSRRLVEASRCGEAVEAAMTAIRVEPLRESAQQALIEAHLGAGNLIEARRTYECYRDLLHRELGVEPGAKLAVLVAAPSERQSMHGDRAYGDSWRQSDALRRLVSEPVSLRVRAP
jgi:DNA-binding SARP family transcriptional activator